MTLDPHTFGDSDAEVTLSKILNEIGDEKTSSYAARFLGQLNYRIKSIQGLDRSTRKFLYPMMRNYAFEKIDKALHFQSHPEVITYMKTALPNASDNIYETHNDKRLASQWQKYLGKSSER